MAASVASFVDLFPEFSSRDAAQLEATLAQVEVRISTEWGALRDEVVYLSLAVALTGGAQGRRARRTPEGKVSYEDRLAALSGPFALSYRVTA